MLQYNSIEFIYLFNIWIIFKIIIFKICYLKSCTNIKIFQFPKCWITTQLLWQLNYYYYYFATHLRVACLNISTFIPIPTLPAELFFHISCWNQSRLSHHPQVHTHAVTFPSQAYRDSHYYYYIDKTTRESCVYMCLFESNMTVKL